MAGRARQIAEGAGIQTYFIFNKVDDDVRGMMTEGLEQDRIITAIPRSNEIFFRTLKGQTLTARMPLHQQLAQAAVTKYDVVICPES